MRARVVVAMQVGGVVALAVTAVGLTAQLRQEGIARPAPSATSFESSTVQDRIAFEDIAEARIELVQTAQTMLRTAHTYGQPVKELRADCWSAVANYNAQAANAGPFWPTNFEASLDPAQECQP